MSILSVQGSTEYHVNVVPCHMYINTDGSIEDAMATGFLNGSDVTYNVTYANTQMALVATTDGVVYLQVDIQGSDISLIKPPTV